jgi:deoxyribodipyrimidine photo-lyase
MSHNTQHTLRRDFVDRADLIRYVQEHFPDASSPEYVSTLRGGHRAAVERLTNAQLARYGETRNYLDGTVTRLSPYIRHGVLSLAEVRDHALKIQAPEEFIKQLSWREYFQRVYQQIGDGIWEDIEPYKTGFSAESYADTLPNDILEARTGTCMDIFCRELRETGYLHNHARLWLAAYVVHWRRVKWQAGARWFLEHLLDGDLASNNLSWQWVASTFSQKPYFFNADNIRRFAKRQYPELLQGRLDPFEGSYEELEARLFPHKLHEIRPQQSHNKKRRRRRSC